jgi:hypothetical protein
MTSAPVGGAMLGATRAIRLPVASTSTAAPAIGRTLRSSRSVGMSGSAMTGRVYGRPAGPSSPQRRPLDARTIC